MCLDLSLFAFRDGQKRNVRQEVKDAAKVSADVGSGDGYAVLNWEADATPQRVSCVLGRMIMTND